METKIKNAVELLKEMGFIWDKTGIGIKHEDGKWNVNVILRNDDGSRKSAYGFMKFETADEAVIARNELQAA